MIPLFNILWVLMILFVRSVDSWLMRILWSIVIINIVLKLLIINWSKFPAGNRGCIIQSKCGERNKRTIFKGMGRAKSRQKMVTRAAVAIPRLSGMRRKGLLDLELEDKAASQESWSLAEASQHCQSAAQHGGSRQNRYHDLANLLPFNYLPLPPTGWTQWKDRNPGDAVHRGQCAGGWSKVRIWRNICGKSPLLGGGHTHPEKCYICFQHIP